ncbi:MAG: hypothetical protein IPO67_04885 [Deltaproteobacteria bacterium]|nr:hypothetical protein [Deltaproteobacteria bacterium]
MALRRDHFGNTLGRLTLGLTLTLAALGAIAGEGGELFEPNTEAVTLSAPALPAKGSGETILTVRRAGRYAVEARSVSGVLIQLVDKARGPGAWAGRLGEQDGRLDVFLEPGTYKLRTRGPDSGKGEVSVVVTPFVEANQPVPELVEVGYLETTLADKQQRSFWIDLTAISRAVTLEAMGPALSELSVWRDGRWRVSVPTRCAEVSPVEGAPMTRCTLQGSLPAGLYLLTASGGPRKVGGAGDPLYVRAGLDVLTGSIAKDGVIGPFGVERVKVRAAPNTTLRLALPQVAPVTISSRQATADIFATAGGSSASVTPKSRAPVATLGPISGDQLITITGAPGQAYSLVGFAKIGETQAINGVGPTLITTVHSGDPQDSIDATGVLTAVDRNNRARLVAASVVPLSDNEGWRRRFNLTETATLQVEVKAEGDYKLISRGGVPLRARIEPHLLSPPEGYKQPALREVTQLSFDDLVPGYYTLTFEPVEPGIVDLELRRDGLTDAAMRVIGIQEALPYSAPRGSLWFGEVTLTRDTKTTLTRNRQPGVDVGLVQRAVPIDLSAPLGLPLAPGQRVTFNVSAPEAGEVSLTDAAGRTMPLGLNDEALALKVRLPKGTSLLTLHNPGAEPAQATLRLAASAARPSLTRPIDPAALALRESLPILPLDAPQHLTLAQRESKFFVLDVKEGGLYTIESAGLLNMTGMISNRAGEVVGQATANHVGRNFSIQRALSPGRYRVSVAPQGASAGDVTILARKVPVEDGGRLVDGRPARAELDAGEALTTMFTLSEEAQVKLLARAQGHVLQCRLEDADGWPVSSPLSRCDLTETLPAGGYRLVVMPSEVPLRAQVSFTALTDDTNPEGHGPHALTLPGAVTTTWMEPRGDAERVPDVFTFSLPAAATLNVSVTGEMGGVLTRAGEIVARLAPGAGLREALPAGDYRLELRNSRRSHGVKYKVSATTDELLVGQSRPVSSSSSIWLSLGQDGPVELISAGPSDVEGRLYDEAGRLIAAEDDRPLDWNFRIARTLPAGRYQLVLREVGPSQGPVTVSLRAPKEREVAALTAPLTRPETPGEEILVVPLTLPDGAELVNARATSEEVVGLALEAKVGGAWRLVDQGMGQEVSLSARVGAPAEAWRLRLWSLDGEGGPAILRVEAPRVDRQPERALGRGVALTRPTRSELPLGAVVVRLDRPGVFTSARLPEGLRVCPAPATACRSAEDGLTSADRELWLVSPLAEGRATAPLIARRASLSSEPVRLRLAPADKLAVDLDAGDGPVLVRVRGGVGARVIPAGEAPTPGQTFGEGDETWAFAESQDRRAAALWLAENAPGPAVVELRQYSFSAPAKAEGRVGVWEDAAPAGQARRYTLPQRGELRVTLSPGLVAVVEDGQGQRLVQAAGDDGAELIVPGAEGSLWVLNPRGEDGHLKAELLPEVGVGGGVLAAKGRFEQRSSRAATTWLRVGADTGGVRVGGDITTATLTTTSGARHQGDRLPAAAGVLRLDHGAGVQLAWAGGRDAPIDPTTPNKTRVNLPSRGQLAGDTTVTLDLPRPSLVQLNLPGPVAVAWGETGAALCVTSSCTLSLALPGGATGLSLRGLAGEPLGGVLEMTATDAVPIGEGVGPEVLLSAGGARLFAFTVPKDAAVGVGARAEADHVELALYTAAGAECSSSAGSWVWWTCPPETTSCCCAPGPTPSPRV